MFILILNFLNSYQKKDMVCSKVISKKNKFQINSKFIVGCDGANSILRKLLDIKLVGSSKEKWLILDLFNSSNKFRHSSIL